MTKFLYNIGDIVTLYWCDSNIIPDSYIGKRYMVSAQEIARIIREGEDVWDHGASHYTIELITEDLPFYRLDDLPWKFEERWLQPREGNSVNVNPEEIVNILEELEGELK